MSHRTTTVAAMRPGPIQRAEPRSEAVELTIRQTEHAHHRRVKLVVFPELALMDLGSCPDRVAPVQCER